MNFGGVGCLNSTWDKVYVGFNGSLPCLVDLNLLHWGWAPSISVVVRLVSALKRSMWRARGPALSMSQFAFVKSGFLTGFEPCNFGTAPEKWSVIVLMVAYLECLKWKGYQKCFWSKWIYWLLFWHCLLWHWWFEVTLDPHERALGNWRGLSNFTLHCLH